MENIHDPADPSNVIKTDQPKPEFTMKELADKLGLAYSNAIRLGKYLGDVHNIEQNKDYLKAITVILQELVSQINIKVENLDSIHTNLPDVPEVNLTLNQEKPDHYVVGVQLFENGKLIGTSLYTTVVKARMIKDVLNKRFAELRVNHEAKLINYPVF